MVSFVLVILFVVNFFIQPILLKYTSLVYTLEPFLFIFFPYILIFKTDLFGVFVIPSSLLVS